MLIFLLYPRRSARYPARHSAHYSAQYSVRHSAQRLDLFESWHSRTGTALQIPTWATSSPATTPQQPDLCLHNHRQQSNPRPC